MRTATAHSLTTYPVLLRLPAGFRAAAESSGSVSIVTPEPNHLSFKIPASLREYGTLTIPPLASLGPRTGDDDVTRGLRPLIGGFQPLDVDAGHLTSQPTHARDQGDALRDADRAPRVKDVKQVRALQAQVVNLTQGKPALPEV